MRRLFTAAIVVGVLAATCAISASIASARSSATPIMVGGDGDLALFPGIVQGFDAGIYRFNKDGGLDGRKIDFTGFLDDGLSATTNLTNAQQLVENNHVMAIVPFGSEVAGAATSTYLAKAKVPFIGWSTDASFTSQPKWGFGITGNEVDVHVESSSLMKQVLVASGQKAANKVRIAIVGVNVPVGVTAVASSVGSAKAEGFHVVYHKAPIPVIGTTSYAPYVQALIASGANVVLELLDAPTSVGLSAGLKGAGFKGQIVNSLTYYPGQLASQPNEASALAGVYVDWPFPANEDDSPAVIQAERDLKAVGASPYLNQGVTVGYWSAIVFEQMLKATLKAVGGDPNKVTSQTLQKTVNSGFTYADPLAGGIGTEYFPAAENIPTGCSTLLKIVGNTYKQVTPFQCLGDVNIVTLKKVNPKTGKDA